MRYVVNQFYDGEWERTVTVQNTEKEARDICTILNNVDADSNADYMVSEVEEYDSKDYRAVVFSGYMQVYADDSFGWELYDSTTNGKKKQDSFEITSDDGDGQYDFLCTLTLGTIIEYDNMYEYLKHMVKERKLKQ